MNLSLWLHIEHTVNIFLFLIHSNLWKLYKGWKTVSKNWVKTRNWNCCYLNIRFFKLINSLCTSFDSLKRFNQSLSLSLRIVSNIRNLLLRCFRCHNMSFLLYFENQANCSCKIQLSNVLTYHFSTPECVASKSRSESSRNWIFLHHMLQNEAMIFRM